MPRVANLAKPVVLVVVFHDDDDNRRNIITPFLDNMSFSLYREGCFAEQRPSAEEETAQRRYVVLFEYEPKIAPLALMRGADS